MSRSDWRKGEILLYLAPVLRVSRKSKGMRRFLSFIKSSSLFVFLILALEASASTPKENTFRFRLLGEPATLDWNRAHTSIETHILVNLMEGLVDLVETPRGLEVRSCLAKSWKVSPDGKTITFEIKKGVKWSDGVELTAKDFVYSWKRLLSPNTAASYAYLLFDVVGARDFNQRKIKDFSRVGIRALSTTRLQVKLEKPVAYWLFLPSFWVLFPLREDIVNRYGEGWARPGRIVTLGPFLYSSHDVNSKITLLENPLYHRKKGNIQKVVAWIIQDDSTGLNLYRSGRLDLLTDIATLDLVSLRKHPDLKTFPYLKTGYLGFVVNRYPMSNVHFRRAVAMAIDKRKIGSILHGGQSPATTFVPPPLFSNSPRIGLRFDPKAAVQELKKAGIEPGAKVELELITMNWDKVLTLSQYIQGELKKNLGISVGIQPFDHKTFRSQVDLHTFPMFLLSWGADYPDPDNFLSVFLSRSGNNRTTWKNQRFDRLVLEARTTKSLRARQRKYRQAERILVEEEAAVLPLFYEPNKALVSPRAKGVRLNPLNYLYLREVNVES